MYPNNRPEEIPIGFRVIPGPNYPPYVQPVNQMTGPGPQSIYTQQPGSQAAYPRQPSNQSYNQQPGIQSAYPQQPGVPSPYSQQFGRPSLYSQQPAPTVQPLNPGYPTQQGMYPTPTHPQPFPQVILIAFKTCFSLH